MYFDEDLVLDIRLNTLNDYVNKFVVAETPKSFWKNKKMILNRKLPKFRKIKYIIEDIPRIGKIY